ncbi:MAG: ATP-binding cassette domain-containing protein [Candidatus Lernaella stagnicola]|nr:ATP-binding cassette domain-containing protein [Candidatus Lernaella stagnicola]
MIAVRHLTKRYGDVTAVDDISFDISKGEVVGFLGPNGAGKSTTMRMLTGFLGNDAGEIRIGGRLLTDDPRAAKSQIGYLPENNPLYEDMTVIEYLRFIGELSGIPASELEAAVSKNIELYGLQKMAPKDIGELSKGYRQRVGLAQASLGDPPIMILDEPTSGLDPNQIVEIRNLIREIGKTKTVILSTHNLAEVEATCSRILIIHNGKLVADDTPDTLESRTAAAILRARLKGDGDMTQVLAEIQGVKNVRPVDVEGEWRTFHLEIEPGAGTAEAVFDACVARQWKLSELRQESTSLEDVFSELTKG